VQQMAVWVHLISMQAEQVLWAALCPTAGVQLCSLGFLGPEALPLLLSLCYCYYEVTGWLLLFTNG
jgi:hypothetical protein